MSFHGLHFDYNYIYNEKLKAVNTKGTEIKDKIMGEKPSEGEESIMENRDTIQVSLRLSVFASKFVRPFLADSSISVQNN